MRRCWKRLAKAAVLVAVFGDAGLAVDQKETPETAVSVPAFSMPPSGYLSDAAKKRQAENMLVQHPSRAEDITILRAFYDGQNSARLEVMRQKYAVDVHADTIAGVPVQIVEPKGGARPEQAGRVLMNLHGGAFMWGAGSGELVEAIPIAAIGGMKVITVDYRMAPEHRFPAGSEDAFSVYKTLLESHAATAIGIYGCSAGGVLTAQTTALILEKGLPAPGAIGTFCGTGLDYGGDSAVLDAALNGQVPTTPLTVGRLSYFSGVTMHDKLVTPGAFPDMLSRFPPTLLLAGSRDFAASALGKMHRNMKAVGTVSDLVLFDGLWHAFFMDADLPESEEAYRIIVSFFDQHLSR